MQGSLSSCLKNGQFSDKIFFLEITRCVMDGIVGNALLL